VADELWGVPIAAEVPSFQTEVSGDQGFVPGRDSQYGAVVAYAFEHTSSDRRLSAEACDQGSFRSRQINLSVLDVRHAYLRYLKTIQGRPFLRSSPLKNPCKLPPGLRSLSDRN